MIQAIIWEASSPAAFVVTNFPLQGGRAVERDAHNAIPGNVSAIDVARIERAPYGYDVYLWEGNLIPVMDMDNIEVFTGASEIEFEKFLNLERRNVSSKKVMT